jgi:hypothetical protein
MGLGVMTGHRGGFCAGAQNPEFTSGGVNMRMNQRLNRFVGVGRKLGNGAGRGFGNGMGLGNGAGPGQGLGLGSGLGCRFLSDGLGNVYTPEEFEKEVLSLQCTRLENRLNWIRQRLQSMDRKNEDRPTE